MKSRAMSSSATLSEPYQRRALLYDSTRPILPHLSPRGLTRGGFLGKDPARWRGTEGYLSPRQGSRKGPSCTSEGMKNEGTRKGPHIHSQPPLPLQTSKGL